MDQNYTSWHLDSWHTQHRHSLDIWSILLRATDRCLNPAVHRSLWRPVQFHSRLWSGFWGDPEIYFLAPFLWNKQICSKHKNCSAIKKDNIMSVIFLVLNTKVFLQQYVTTLSITRSFKWKAQSMCSQSSH